MGIMCERLLESFEDVIGDDVSVEGNILLQQIGDRNNDMIVVFNESSIEIGEFDKGLNVQNASRNGPGENRIDFGRVHANPFRCDNII